MLIIGEKINGSIPAVAAAIAARDDSVIRDRVRRQIACGSDYLDCAAGTSTDLEYDAMCWLLGVIQSETDAPICVDSPDARLLARILEEGIIKRPGMINSVSEEGDKCEIIFPLLARTDWNVIGLCCDDDGVPASPDKRLDIAKRIIEKADRYGIPLANLHIDPCVMALSSCPSAMNDFIYCIKAIHEHEPTVKVIGAVSNISFNMPARKFINMGCMYSAIRAGLDSVIFDPTSENMMGIMYAASALSGADIGGRKYNRAYRKGLFGKK